MRFVTSLKNKIILSVSAILAVTIGLGTWINIENQRAELEHALEDNVLIISNTIGRSLDNAMLQGKSKEVQSILEAVGEYHNIREVKIFSQNGVILKSSDRGMIGRKVEPAVQKWYLENQFKKPIKRRGESVFTVLFPIENTEHCFRCHGSRERLNGILAVDVSMAHTQQEIAELSKTMFLWALGITSILAVSLSMFLTRFVTNPIQELIRTMERAERGLDVRADVRSPDDLGRLAEAFNSMLSKLESAKRSVEKYHYEQMTRADRLASIGEMAAGIAHEIKNPLAGITGVIQVLKRDLAPNDPKRPVYTEIIAQVERLDKAVRNLLSFARPPEPKLTLVDVNEQIGKVLDFLAPQFAKNGIVSERKLAPSLPWLTLDPDLIQQALLNITLNAVQSMPGGGRLLVETGITPPAGGIPGRVQISISDTGKGINPDHLGKIFNPFFTTRQQGTGLGLAITQRIIEQHHGEILVTSPHEKGATFTILLPYLADGKEPRGAENYAAEDTRRG